MAALRVDPALFPRDDDYYTEKAIRDWEPDWRPVACANCLHAKVYRAEDRSIMARCARGHDKGKPVELVRLIRQKAPRGFAEAKSCVDFHSMSDDA
jgi:hypothetical protein